MARVRQRYTEKPGQQRRVASPGPGIAGPRARTKRPRVSLVRRFGLCWSSARMRWLVFTVFALTWVGISARRVRILPIGRPAMALVGAAAAVVVGLFAGEYGLSVDEALRAVELHTLALLLGMMVVAAGLGEAGFFDWAVGWLARRSLCPAALVWVVTLGSGLLSAVLVNDAVCLLATPLVVLLVRQVGAPVRPFLFAVAMGSNAGSALTLAGNPQNMLVAKLSGLSYRGYFVSALLPTLAALVLTAAFLHLVFRKALAAPLAGRPALEPPKLDKPLLFIGAAALAGVVLANLLGAPLALTAVAGASVVLLAARLKAEALLHKVDWSILLFFAGLFVLVAALQKTGLPAEALRHVDGAHAGVGPLVGVLLFGSQVVSNVPLILLLEPWIRLLPDAPLAWTLTAYVSTLAGNLTLLGSVANIIVLERARESLGFFEYLKVGLPLTLASTALGVALLLALG
ncbi:MAG: SLC13 family permease [Myxococcota bacterium]